MNNKHTPDNSEPEMTPEQKQILHANRLLMQFTNEILASYFPFEKTKADELTQEEFDKLPKNKEGLN